MGKLQLDKIKYLVFHKLHNNSCHKEIRVIIWYIRKRRQYRILSPWSRFLLEKLTGSQLVKKVPAF
jgi:hypothetical protein